MRAEIRVIVAKIGCKAVNSNVFGTVRASDRDELPAFGMYQERFFEGARAEEFDKFQAVTFPALRASNSAR